MTADDHRRPKMKTILAAFLATGLALTGITATAYAAGSYVPNRTTVTGDSAG
jgi:hypothetical protein